MTHKPFPHKFKNAFGMVDIFGADGYAIALSHVVDHVKEVTQSKPENRYIDSIDLLKRIEVTNIELMQLLKDAEDELNHLKNIL